MLKPICAYWKEDIGGKPCSSYLQGGYCLTPRLFRCIEYIRNNEPPLSYSSIVDYTACKKKYYFSTIMGLQIIDPGWPRLIGKLFSDACDKIHDRQFEGHLTDDLLLGHIKPYIPADDVTPDALLNLQGLILGYTELNKEGPFGHPQFEFRWNEDGYPKVHGYIDMPQYLDGGSPTIAYEIKTTQRPDSYSKFIVQDQLATYFIGLPSLQRMVLRVVLRPMFRLGRKESNTDMINRVKNDIIKMPKKYITDISYWRSEFDLQETKKRARRISNEMLELIEYNDDWVFYPTSNRMTCITPSQCDYLSICQSGVISDTIFKKRSIK